MIGYLSPFVSVFRLYSPPIHSYPSQVLFNILFPSDSRSIPLLLFPPISRFHYHTRNSCFSHSFNVSQPSFSLCALATPVILGDRYSCFNSSFVPLVHMLSIFFPPKIFLNIFYFQISTFHMHTALLLVSLFGTF